MLKIDPRTFTGTKAWEALNIANIEGASIRLHWTDKPYIWHKNDGDEVFIVLDGQFIMSYKKDGIEHQTILNTGDICFFREGEEHVASPQGIGRAIVIEKRGSI